MKFFGTKVRKWFVRVAMFIGIIALAFWLARVAQDNMTLREFVAGYGYLGIFLVSFMSGLNFIIPIPAVSFLPLFLEAGFNMWITITIMVLAVTVADVVAYVIGVLGRHAAILAKNKKMFTRLDKLRNLHYWGPLVALFLYSLIVPLPNELLVIPLGFMGYHLRHLFPILLVGNGVFTVLAAFGVVGIFNLL